MNVPLTGKEAGLKEKSGANGRARSPLEPLAVCYASLVSLRILHVWKRSLDGDP